LKYDWVKIAARCKRRPGEWVSVFKQDKQTYVTTLHQSGIAALRREKGFEFRSANNRIKQYPRVCDLWVRYVPEKDQQKGSK
jgi:hypothetical protein